jgi:predicted dehydrogenase/aryl-alcohol dehydrogenase-like predicted oxidoreductase
MSEHAGSDKLAWGIIGTGGIAHRFAGAVGTSRTGRLAAVASRTQTSADKFGDEFGIPKRYEGYDALLADPEVQAVYISLPNHLHAEWTVRCAEAGKHILCEKPLATNYAEAMVAVEVARLNGVFLMEAFMYRCHPQTRALADRIREGAIGEVRVIQANFAFNMRGPRPENVRQQNPAAGGGIMDVGCYCASMARLVAGAAVGGDPAEAEVVKGVGYINPTNRVDEWATAAVRFPGDIVANLTCGIQVGVESVVRVWGSEGHIVVTNPWFPGDRADSKVLVYRNGQDAPEEVVAQGEVPLYSIEADMVAEAVAAGRQQATYPCMTWEDSLANMRLLDAWRQEIGLVFDNETSEGLERPFAGRPLRREPDAPMRYGQVEGVTAPVSRIVMGSMVFRTGGLRLACALLDDYFRAGGRTIDTAYVYGSEKPVGEWLRLRGVREEMSLIVKGAHTPYCTPADLTRQLHESLANLQTDYADLYMMHRDDPQVPVGEFVDVLNEHLRAGRIRAFGGSNWTIERIEAANAYAREHGLVGFAASSPNYSLAEWNEPMWAGCVAAVDPASRAWYERTQMPLFAWSSQASGLFTGRFRPEDRDNPALAPVVRTWFNDANFRRLERARELATRKGTTSTDIALAYVLNQPLNIYALIGPRTLEELRSSLGALEVSLSAEELRWLNLEG